MAESGITVTVCWIDDGQAPSMQWLELSLPPGCTLERLLECAQLAPLATRVHAGELGVAIYGRKALAETILRDGDRVELLGELLVDPKLARRARVRRGSER